MQVGFIQSIEGLKSKHVSLEVSQRRQNSVSRLPHRNSAWVSSFQTDDCSINFCLMASLLACHMDFKLTSPHSHISQFLKINSYLSVYLLFVLFLWRTLTYRENYSDWLTNHLDLVIMLEGRDSGPITRLAQVEVAFLFLPVSNLPWEEVQPSCSFSLASFSQVAVTMSCR